MRYAKGTLIVSRERDIPLLRQVRNSKFISHNQLFELMKLAGFDHDKDCFNWRLRRLKKFGHVLICSEVHGADSTVYRISKNGIALLEHFGQFTTVLNSTSDHVPHLSQAYHALELNQIQLALASKNLVAGWQSEIEVASLNTVSQSPYRKDYDAIVDVWLGERRARFALEYERSLKTLSHYGHIRKALEDEMQVDCVLYLTSGVELLVPLIQELGSVKKTVAFTSAKAFEHDLLDSQVFLGQRSAAVAFRSLLQ